MLPRRSPRRFRLRPSRADTTAGSRNRAKQSSEPSPSGRRSGKSTRRSNPRRPSISRNPFVAGLFLGTRSTGGYAVEITGVDRHGADVIVRYRETKPDPGMMVTQVLSSPFHIVTFENTTGQVKFQKAS